jgi:hypothetical protein
MLYRQGITAEDITKDDPTRTLIAEINLDQGHDHDNHGPDNEHYLNSINDLIHFDIKPQLKLNPQQLQAFVGIYKQQGKSNVELLIINDRLVARQKSGFISWLKPTTTDKFDSMSFFSEKFVFERDEKTAIVGLNVIFPNDTIYEDKLSGHWGNN